VGVAEDFERAIGAGGVVVFPSDTVYGLACDPENSEAIERMYALKGRDRGKPAARMWFSVEALPPLTPRVAAVARELLPGPVTLVVGELGIRVPDVPVLAGVPVCVLQTSANLSGGPDPRTVAEVPEAIRDSADLVIDGGDLPGVPSSVVDLSEYEASGEWSVLREGALPLDRLEACLRRS
jgi:L-threonylcarbamoyladenylate synthase